jgi:hypothetical protein
LKSFFSTDNPHRGHQACELSLDLLERLSLALLLSVKVVPPRKVTPSGLALADSPLLERPSRTTLCSNCGLVGASVTYSWASWRDLANTLMNLPACSWRLRLRSVPPESLMVNTLADDWRTRPSPNTWWSITAPLLNRQAGARTASASRASICLNATSPFQSYLSPRSKQYRRPGSAQTFWRPRRWPGLTHSPRISFRNFGR